MIRRAIAFAGIIIVLVLIAYGVAAARPAGRPALWYATTSLPAPRHVGSILAYGNRIHYLGGVHGNYIAPQIYVASFESNGAISSWWRTLDLPSPRSGPSTVVRNDRLYVLGGWTGSDCSVGVYTTQIRSDGSLVGWTPTTFLPRGLVSLSVVLLNNRLYVIGGECRGDFRNVYFASINADGSLGSWIETTPFPEVRSDARAFVYENAIYLMGGKSIAGNAGTARDTIHRAVPHADGTIGKWELVSRLPRPLSNFAFVLDESTSEVHILGGMDDTGRTYATTYSTTIREDGTFGPWSEEVDLPAPGYNYRATVIDQRVYVIGGVESTGSVLNQVIFLNLRSASLIERLFLPLIQRSVQ